jgi:hypothetical protein
VKRLAALVAKELGPAPAIEQKVLEPVVVVIAEHGAHRHTGLKPIEVRDAELSGHVLERAIAPVAIQAVLRSPLCCW